jgi:homoserine O-acetyltransferase
VSEVSADRGEQQFARLGDLTLESGETLQDVEIGFRVYGPNPLPDGSNVIVWPMWFGGQSQETEIFELVGPGLLLDTNKYHVIAIDPIGNGLSSSPDQTPGRFRFPDVTIGDMVRSEHRLLTEVLKISHVKAVIGYSMGGMQTFEWLVAYPNFMDKAVPLVGTPRSTGFEAINLGAQLAALEAADEPTVAFWGPEFLATMIPEEGDDFALAEFESHLARGFGPMNWALQTRAAIGQDISRQFGGDLSLAAAEVQAEILVVVHERDGWNAPGPALEFANFLGAETLVLTGFCDHLSYFCGDGATVNDAVSAFLEN